MIAQLILESRTDLRPGDLKTNQMFVTLSPDSAKQYIAQSRETLLLEVNGSEDSVRSVLRCLLKKFIESFPPQQTSKKICFYVSVCTFDDEGRKEFEKKVREQFEKPKKSDQYMMGQIKLKFQKFKTTVIFKTLIKRYE